jgi:hypothetical protein
MAITINGSGTIGGVSVGGLPDGIVDTDMLASGAITDALLPAGSVLQVINIIKTDHFSTSSTSYTDVTGLSTSITPSNSSNKILVIACINFASTSDDVFMRLVRNSTEIAGGTSGSSFNGLMEVTGNVPVRYGMTYGGTCYLDSPSTTSATTYKIQLCAPAGTSACVINRRGNDGIYGGSSTITLMEIAG